MFVLTHMCSSTMTTAVSSRVSDLQRKSTWSSPMITQLLLWLQADSRGSKLLWLSVCGRGREINRTAQIIFLLLNYLSKLSLKFIYIYTHIKINKLCLQLHYCTLNYFPCTQGSIWWVNVWMSWRQSSGQKLSYPLDFPCKFTLMTIYYIKNVTECTYLVICIKCLNVWTCYLGF